MKIAFVRSGGFAGLRLDLALDTDALPADEAVRIHHTVEASGFFDLRQSELRGGVGADRFEYRIEIESHAHGGHSLAIPESAMPEGLRPLVEELTAMAMRRRGA